MCEEGPQRTRERPERRRWVRKELPAHTGEAKAMVLGAEKASSAHRSGQSEGAECGEGPSAHGSGQSEGAGCGETLQRTRERPKRRCWVRRDPSAHTGVAGVMVLGAERTPSAHGSGRSEGVVDGKSPQRTQERPERRCWVRRRVLVHTGAAGAMVLGAERASSAHRSDRSKGAGGIIIKNARRNRAFFIAPWLRYKRYLACIPTGA